MLFRLSRLSRDRKSMAIYKHEDLCRVFDSFRTLYEEATMLEYTAEIEKGFVLEIKLSLSTPN